MKIRFTPARGVLVLLVLVTVAVGASYAAIPGSNGVINACRDNKGTLKVIDAEAGQSCSAGQTPLSWNKQGPAGPQGPSGVVKTFSIGALWNNTPLPGNWEMVTPNACRTAPYTAGSGEVAVMTVSGSVHRPGSWGGLAIWPVASIDGGPFLKKQSVASVGANADNASHASAQVVFYLQADKSYVFGTGFASPDPLPVIEHAAGATLSCEGAILIIKAA